MATENALHTGSQAPESTSEKPVLTVGQQIKADNVLCKSERSGIVCTIASGRHKGTGFLISTKLVRRLG